MINLTFFYTSLLVKLNIPKIKLNFDMYLDTKWNQYLRLYFLVFVCYTFLYKYTKHIYE